MKKVLRKPEVDKIFPNLIKGIYKNQQTTSNLILTDCFSSDWKIWTINTLRAKHTGEFPPSIVKKEKEMRHTNHKRRNKTVSVQTA